MRTGEGEFALDVQLDDLPEVDGFLELWIIDTEVKGMYSLGPVTASGLTASRCGRAVAMSINAADSCPPRKSCSSGAAPLYGRCVIRVPVFTRNISIAICDIVPVPADE